MIPFFKNLVYPRTAGGMRAPPSSYTNPTQKRYPV